MKKSFKGVLTPFIGGLAGAGLNTIASKGIDAVSNLAGISISGTTKELCKLGIPVLVTVALPKVAKKPIVQDAFIGLTAITAQNMINDMLPSFSAASNVAGFNMPFNNVAGIQKSPATLASVA